MQARKGTASEFRRAWECFYRLRPKPAYYNVEAWIESARRNVPVRWPNGSTFVLVEDN